MISYNFSPIWVEPQTVIETFTSGSGTWTAPTGVTSIIVQCWGGGGGGGSAPSSSLLIK